MRIKTLAGGEWLGGSQVIDDLNPSDISDRVAQVELGNGHVIDQCIDAAFEASREWANSTPQQRSDALDFIGSSVLTRRAELGELLAREEGKTLVEAVGEVVRAGQIFKFFAGEALRLSGQTGASVRPGIGVEITREPVGVIAAIAPFNFPAAIPAWKVAPAIAFGNTVVLKPAQAVPALASALAEIIDGSPLPNGVFNLAIADGRAFGERIVESPKVAAITFTGSNGVGRQLGVNAVAAGKRIQLEMGGKNPLVVLDDADLQVAVEAALQGAFYSTGQRCTASSRLIVSRGIHDQFVSELQRRMEALKVGHALDAESQIGPVVDEAQLQKNEKYLEIGSREGARVTGGDRVEGRTSGWFMRPALLTGTSNDMRINQEEVFGPIASVIQVSGYDEALAVANDTELGLSAGICTTSLKHATHFKRHSEAGMVMVNLPTAGVDYHVPFGGRKGSSYGPREQGEYAREFFTLVKTAYTLA